MPLKEYVCESELSYSDIVGALATGELTKWARDAQGRQWFKRPPLIKGVPSCEDRIDADGFIDVADETDDDGLFEVEWIGDDDE